MQVAELAVSGGITGLHRQRHLHKPSPRRANSAELPPLRALPPPITLHSQPAVDVDLDVDYQAEVAPFLGQCLVSTVISERKEKETLRISVIIMGAS